MLSWVIIISLASLNSWTLQKAQQFYTAGDGENFKKWKTINTVIIVAQWVIPLALNFYIYTLIHSAY